MMWWENRKEQVEQKAVPLSFVVCGDVGCSKEITMEMDLVKGESPKKVVKFDLNEIGEIEKIRFKMSEKAKSKTVKWEISKLHLKNMTTQEVQTFEFEKPVVYNEAGDSTVEVTNLGIPITIYHVELHTADRRGFYENGIKAKVKIQGSDGDTGERMALEDSIDGKGGQIVQFDVEGIDIGDITGVLLTTNREKKEVSDFVEKIVVTASDERKKPFVANYPRQILVAPKPSADKNEYLIWWENRESQESYTQVTAGFTVVGKKNTTGQFDLTFDLKPGTSEQWKLNFDASKIGKIDKVRMKMSDKVPRRTRWDIAKLHLLHSHSGEQHTFEFEKPAVKKGVGDSTVEASKFGVPLSIYRVELHTGDRTELFANDVVARMIIRGSEGDTGPRTVVNAPMEGIIKIEEGGVLRFEIESIDIGNVRGIVFTHNKPGRNAPHFLQRIVVRPAHSKTEEYVLDFGKNKPKTPAVVMEQRQGGGKGTDPRLWHLSFTNQPSQPNDRLQISTMLFGDNGKSRPYDLYVDLTPGDSPEYPIVIDEDIGILQKVRFGYGPKEKKDHQWDISEARFLNVATGMLFRFSMGKPVRPAPQAAPMVKPNSKAPKDCWQLWWENRDNQEPYKDISIGFIVVGEKGSTKQFNYSIALKAGESDKKKLEFDPKDVGDIDKVRIVFGDDVAKKTKWDIAKLHLCHLRTGMVHTFEFPWGAVKKPKGDSTFEAPARQGIPISVYEIELHTADRLEMFNDDVKAKIMLRGTEGDTGERTIVDAPNEGRLKEKPGDVLKLEIESVDIGEINGISFRHNKPGKKTWQFLQKIVVRPMGDRDREQTVEFDPEVEIKKQDRDIWHIWWENRDAQPELDNIGITFVIVGEDDDSEPYPFTVDLRPGKSDKLQIRMDPKEVGVIDKVRIKMNDGTKFMTKWDIKRLHLVFLYTEEKHTFEFEKPIEKTKAIDNTVEVTNRGIPISIYHVQMYTGDRTGLFDAPVVARVVICGSDGDTGPRTAYNKREPASKDIKPGDLIEFDIESIDIGEVKTVRLIHNMSAKRPGDYIERIVIKPEHEDETYEFEFPKKKKANDDEGKMTVEQLEPMETADPREWILSWTNYEIQPRDRIQISLVLVGDSGKSQPYLMDVELAPFESKEYPMIVNEEVGDLLKLRFGYGPKTKGDHKWEVQEVRMKHVASGLLHKFGFGAPPKPPSSAPRYRIETYMRKQSTNIASESSIYMKLKGDKMISDKFWLEKSLNNVVKFKPGQMDVFETEDIADVGEVLNITFGGPDDRIVAALRSYLTKVIVVPLHWKTRKEFVFSFGQVFLVLFS